MITLLVIKKTLKKVWTWLKHNWKVPFVLIAVLFLWLGLRKKDVAKKVLEIRDASYKAQINEINRSHEEEIKKRNEIIIEYNNLLETLEKEHEEEFKKLNKNKKKKIKEIIEKYHNNPNELTRKVSEEFGFDYIEE